MFFIILLITCGEPRHGVDAPALIPIYFGNDGRSMAANDRWRGTPNDTDGGDRPTAAKA